MSDYIFREDPQIFCPMEELETFLKGEPFPVQESQFNTTMKKFYLSGGMNQDKDDIFYINGELRALRVKFKI